MGAAASALAACLAGRGGDEDSTRWTARGGRPSCTVTVAVLLLLGGPVRIGCLGRGPCTARPTQNMGRRHRTVFSVTVDDEDEDDDETARGRRERQVA